MKKCAKLVAVLCMVASSAFAITRNFRIYNVQTGAKIEAAFKFKWSSMTGRVEAHVPDGEALEGEYSGSNDGGIAWGSIYSSAGSATATSSFMGKVRGTMIMTGKSGLVINCEYVTNPTTTHGNGACKDNRAGSYTMLF
jgi:hypothetical protein